MEFDQTTPGTELDHIGEHGIPSDTFEQERGIDASLFKEGSESTSEQSVVISTNDLLDLERRYTKPDVTTGVTDLASKKYSELLDRVTEAHWTPFQKELNDVKQAPFETNGELPAVLNELYLSEKEKLTLSFDKDKEKIESHTRNNIERAVANTLAQKNVYQKLKDIYSKELGSTEVVPKTEIYEMRKKQKQLIDDFIERRTDFVVDAFRQFNDVNLPQLELDLEESRDFVVKDSLDNIQTRASNPIHQITDRLIDATEPAITPIKEQMKSKLFDLESKNDSVTLSAVKDFSIKLKRAMREEHKNDYRIDVTEYQAPVTNSNYNEPTLNTNETSPDPSMDEISSTLQDTPLEEYKVTNFGEHDTEKTDVEGNEILPKEIKDDLNNSNWMDEFDSNEVAVEEPVSTPEEVSTESEPHVEEKNPDNMFDLLGSTDLSDVVTNDDDIKMTEDKKIEPKEDVKPINDFDTLFTEGGLGIGIGDDNTDSNPIEDPFFNNDPLLNTDMSTSVIEDTKEDSITKVDDTSKEPEKVDDLATLFGDSGLF